MGKTTPFINGREEQDHEGVEDSGVSEDATETAASVEFAKVKSAEREGKQKSEKANGSPNERNNQKANTALDAKDNDGQSLVPLG